MKRSPLRRKTALRVRRRAAPAPATPEAAAEREDLRRRQEAFKAAVEGERCVVCGKTKQEAYRATGYGHRAHHAVRRQVLRRRGLDEWDPRDAVAACEEPCHRQHHSRKRPIRVDELPGRTVAFVAENELWDELRRECPE